MKDTMDGSHAYHYWESLIFILFSEGTLSLIWGALLEEAPHPPAPTYNENTVCG